MFVSRQIFEKGGEVLGKLFDSVHLGRLSEEAFPIDRLPGLFAIEPGLQKWVERQAIAAALRDQRLVPAIKVARAQRRGKCLCRR